MNIKNKIYARGDMGNCYLENKMNGRNETYIPCLKYIKTLSDSYSKV